MAYSKRMFHPKLNDEAREKIVAYYVQTRQGGGESDDSVAITARSLEALSRLAEASARIRLSEVATAEDADRSIRLTKTWRHELMGENFDMTTIESGKKGKVRNQEKAIIDIVSVLQNDSGTAANLLDVLTEPNATSLAARRRTSSTSCVETDDERPSGYDTLQIV